MNNGGLVLIIGSLLSAAAAFIWLALRLENTPKRGSGHDAGSYTDAAKEDVEHIFNEDFREELRNRGRLHFETMMGENATVSQHDLQQTTTDVKDYLPNEITRAL